MLEGDDEVEGRQDACDCGDFAWDENHQGERVAFVLRKACWVETVHGDAVY